MTGLFPRRAAHLPGAGCPSGIPRREFLCTATTAVAAATLGCLPTQPVAPVLELSDVRLHARPHPPTRTIPRGYTWLGLTGPRDSIVFVPDDYQPGTPAALLVLLHGAGGSAASWQRMPFADLLLGRNVVVLLASSAGPTWDLVPRADNADIERIDRALAETFDRCSIAPDLIALGGFSDGASYALSVGLANGDLLNALIAFSPGYIAQPARVGTPRIFVAHGTFDTVLPVGITSRRFVPTLRSAGYSVEYREFAGGHDVTFEEADGAVAWFLGSGGPAPSFPSIRAAP